MFEIIPGILEKEWSRIEKKLETIKPFAKTVHIDIIDGIFAQNITFLDPEPFKKYSSDFFFELHMMVEEPIDYLKPWGEAGFKRFLGHIEKMSDQEKFIKTAKQYGEAGLALDGPTDLSELKVPISSLETILFMSIKAGFSGQEFNIDYLSKIKEAKEKGFGGTYEVDGGINNETIVLAKNAGATRFVSTSYLFGCQNIEEEFKKLTSSINGMGAEKE